jgi:hypothetical protein
MVTCFSRRLTFFVGGCTSKHSMKIEKAFYGIVPWIMAKIIIILLKGGIK